MKGSLQISNTIHDLKKANLVTLKDGSDEYVCGRCGIKGKRPNLNDRVVFSRVRKDLFNNCIPELIEQEQKVAAFQSRKIRLTRGLSIHKNPGLDVGTVWDTCLPPEKYKNDTGTWAQGPGSEFKVFPNEFEYV